MGQKTHPKGLRLEVNKNWTSNWFPKKNAYANDLAQDIKLRKYLKKRLQDASVASVIIERTSQAITVTIHTARPGIVIGRGGEEVSRREGKVVEEGGREEEKEGGRREEGGREEEEEGQGGGDAEGGEIESEGYPQYRGTRVGGCAGG